SSVSVVCEENITLESAPGGIGADEFINGAPALFILRSELGFHGRISNHLPPKETVQVVTRGTRDHAIRDVKIGKGVMVKIPGVAAPRPTRSEEHTSELQSRGHLVCRLLLEKKK